MMFFKKGEVVSADKLNRVLNSLINKITGDGDYIRVDSVNGRVSIKPGKLARQTHAPILCTFTTEYKNYIEASHFGQTLKIAKPPITRQDDEEYSGVNLTSTDVNTVDTDQSESWIIAPPYISGNTIIALPIKQKIKDDSGEDFMVYWLDISGRRWALDES